MVPSKEPYFSLFDKDYCLIVLGKTMTKNVNSTAHIMAEGKTVKVKTKPISFSAISTRPSLSKMLKRLAPTASGFSLCNSRYIQTLQADTRRTMTP